MLRARPGLPQAWPPPTGARRTRRCWPTSRSSTATASAAARPSSRTDLEQWFFRIREYADELLDFSRPGVARPDRDDADELDRPLRGSRGRRSAWTCPASTQKIDPRLHHAPRHDLWRHLHGARPGAPAGRADHNTRAASAEVEAYVDAPATRPRSSAPATEREKTGVFTGAYCTNRFNGDRCRSGSPTTRSSGTAPALSWACRPTTNATSSSRRSSGCECPVVIAPPDWDGEPLEEAYTDPGTMVNSGQFDGMSNEDGKRADHRLRRKAGLGPAHDHVPPARLADLAAALLGHADPDDLLRDGRHRAGAGGPDLPVVLPDDAEFLPTGESPLARHEGFVNTTCPKCGRPRRSARRTRWTRSWTPTGTSCAT